MSRGSDQGLYEEMNEVMRRIVSEAKWKGVRKKGRESLLVICFQQIKMKTDNLV